MRRVKQIALEVNGGCNLKCPSCPQSTGRERDFLKKLPFDTFKNIIDDGLSHGLEVVSLQGSGEPTLNTNLPDYIEYLSSKSLKSIVVSNGVRITPSLYKDYFAAGLSFLRISAIGADQATYKKYMSADNFELVRSQVREGVEIVKKFPSSQLSTYHLITDPTNTRAELDLYLKNWVNYAHVYTEIWQMHNWGGSQQILFDRSLSRERRSCGRPSADYLTVRAGGLDGEHAAVVPCCYVLGRDSRAVLGHLSSQTISEVFNSDKYLELIRAHEEHRFDDIDYCRSCDQLYHAPESLVYSNLPGRKYGYTKFSSDLNFLGT